jgi:glucokinase-like ROK family protein
MKVLSMTANVLQIIRRSKSPMAKTDIAFNSGLSLSAVTDHVERLISKRLIVVSTIGNSSGGRKPLLYSLNKNFGFVISIELGTTSIQVAITDFHCNILISKVSSININEGPDIVLTHIYKIVHALLMERNIEKDLVKGIGIGIPGPVEFASGLPISPSIMPGWDQYPIRDFWSKYFDCPCYVDNDVNITALGEHAKGLQFEIDNMIYIKVGTGIGSAIIYDGKLYRGSSGSAGDIGHMDVGGDVICWCGNRGCFEAMAGGKAIVSKAKELALSGKSEYLLEVLKESGELTLNDIGSGIQRLDPVCVELIRESGALIGRVIASLVNYSNPSLVSIGGKVTDLGDILLAAIRQGVYHRSLPLATRNLLINKSILGSMAGLIGGAFMTVDQLIINSTDDKSDAFLDLKENT